MADKTVTQEAAGAAIADADLFRGVQNGSSVKLTFALVKTWIKSWIVKADVGLGNVANTDTTTQTNVNFIALTAAGAVANGDTLPVNQGAANLKQTFTAIQTWIRSWIVKADVGLGNVDNTSDATKNAAAVTLTNKTLGATTLVAGIDAGGNTINNVSINPTTPNAGQFTSCLANSSMGYVSGQGAGSAIGQTVSKSQGVTINNITGQITMNAALLAAAGIVSFVVTCNKVSGSDVVILNHISGGTPGAYTLNAQTANGSFTINVRNNTAGSLSEAVVIQYAIIKSTTN